MTGVRPPSARRARRPSRSSPRRRGGWPASAPGPAATSTTPCCRRSSPSASPPARRSASGRGCATSSASRHPARTSACCCRRAPTASPAARRGGSTRSASRPSGPGRSPRSAASPTGCGTGRACRSTSSPPSSPLVSGIGPWTVASVLGPVRGDDDAVIVGDYHLPSMVSWNLAGEARGRRRPHARTARTVPRRARPGRPAARHGRPPPARVRPAPTDPADAPMVMARTTPAERGDRTAAGRHAIRRGADHRRSSRRRPGERPAALVAAGADDRHLRLRRVPAVRPRRRRRARQPGDGGRRRGPRAAGRARPLGLITGVFTQWDGLWYLEIVRNGYPRSIPAGHHLLPARGARRVLPAVPDARARRRPHPARAATRSPPSPSSTGLALVAVVLVGVLARRLYGNDVAERAMVLFAVFPGSFVLTYAYAEALLIVLAAACLWFLLDERWLLAGVAAALATATRPNGVALVAACAVAAFLAIRRSRDWWSLVAPLLAPIGFVAFQLFLAAHTGESWPWFRVQREAWREGHQLRSDGDQQHDQLPRPPLRVADGRPHRGIARRPRPRAVVPVAQAAAVADGRLHRRRHRPHAAAGDGHGTARASCSPRSRCSSAPRRGGRGATGRSGTSSSSPAAPGLTGLTALYGVFGAIP